MPNPQTNKEHQCAENENCFECHKNTINSFFPETNKEEKKCNHEWNLWDNKYICCIKCGLTCEISTKLLSSSPQAIHTIREEWEDEFVDKFAVMLERSLYDAYQIEEVYKFINDLLESYGNTIRAEIREKIERLKKEYPAINTLGRETQASQIQGYNSALDDILASIAPKE